MIYFLRHGLDDERYIGGWSDTDLTEAGKNQVKAVSKFIQDNDFTINQIIASDIKRAITTSKIVNANLQKPLVYSPLLRELNKGLLTGVLKKSSTFKPLTIIDQYPGGESMLQFYKRIKKNKTYFLNNDNTLFITHRGVINMLYCIVNKQTPDLNKTKFSVEHASLHEYDPLIGSIKRIY